MTLCKNNEWRRPLYFIKRDLDQDLKRWLGPYLRDEGLVHQLVPDSSRTVDVAIIESNLSKIVLRGYNDSSVLLDDQSIYAGRLYYDLFLNVARSKVDAGARQEANEWIQRMKMLLPFDRLQPGSTILKATADIEEKIINR